LLGKALLETEIGSSPELAIDATITENGHAKLSVCEVQVQIKCLGQVGAVCGARI